MSDPTTIRELLDEGLAHYGLGQVEQALNKWKKVLELDPANARAKEYIKFVNGSWAPLQKAQSTQLESVNKHQDQALESNMESLPPIPRLPPNEPLEKPVFTPPARTGVHAAGWGDLYELGESQAQMVGINPSAASEWFETPVFDQSKPPSFSDSTLPPYPDSPSASIHSKGEEPEIPIDIDEPEAAKTDETVTMAPPSVLPFVSTAPEISGDVPTKKYESVPTAVRPPPNQLIDSTSIRIRLSPRPPFLKPTVQQDTNPTLDEVTKPDLPTKPGKATHLGIFKQDISSEKDLGSAILDLVSGAGEAAQVVPSVASQGSPHESENLLKGAKEMLELDDFSSAIELLEKVFEIDPENEKGREMFAEAEQNLMGILTSKIGDLNKIPRVRMAQDEVIWLNLNHRAGFLLSLVDGKLSFDEILTVCGLPQIEVLRILVQLLQDKVIEVN